MAETPMRELSAEKVFSEYGTMVYRLLYARTGNKQDAEDLLQEVFLRYHRVAPSFQSEDHRKAWLLTVAANCAKSLLRSPWHRRTVPLEDVYRYDDPEASAVDQALARLDGKYRSVVHLYYYEGYDTGEIAQILGRRPSTVRAQLTRARRMLAELLKEEL